MFLQDLMLLTDMALIVDISIAGTIVTKSKDVYGLLLYQFTNIARKLDTKHSNLNIAEEY
jgi:hypothetical protein